jgi:hypothetical protein
VVCLPTSKGYAYLLYTHRHRKWGELVRVLPGLFTEECTDLASLVKRSEAFSTFFLLTMALKHGLVRYAGHVNVPEPMREFPVFRNGLADPETGKVHVWWLWDGEKEWKVGALTDTQKRFPLHRIPNHAQLVEWVESGWRPELDESTA